MRLFVAIPLAEEVRAHLVAVQERLQTSGADIKWVEPENLHLTVSFLGDQQESLLPDLEAVWESVVAETYAFRIGVRGGSAFPKRGPTVKTLWVGVTEGADAWKELVRRAESLLLPFGVPREGGLMPHVTLGRVRNEAHMEALRAALAAEAQTDCGGQAADRLELIQSTLDPRGATYETLRTWQLQER